MHNCWSSDALDGSYAVRKLTSVSHRGKCSSSSWRRRVLSGEEGIRRDDGRTPYTPSVVSMTAFIVASTILPADNFTRRWSLLNNIAMLTTAFRAVVNHLLQIPLHRFFHFRKMNWTDGLLRFNHVYSRFFGFKASSRMT
jgi:hypothetical protein